MASFDYRLNPIRAIKECSSCGALYTADFCCSKEGLEDKILVPIPESSQRPIIIEKICFDCGDLVRGLYCRECALIRKTLEEVFQNLQDTSRSSDDNTNVVNAPREPIVVKQHDSVCLEPADKEDEVVNFLMVNFFKKVFSRSMNKEEPPMNCTKLGRIFGNLIQLWVQFISDNGAGDESIIRRTRCVGICYNRVRRNDDEIDSMVANQLKAFKGERMKAKAALNLLFQSVDESGFEKIVGASIAKEALDILEKECKGIRALSGAQDVWECVTTGYEEPSATEIGAMSTNQMKAWKEKYMKDKRALYLLFQSVDESGFEKITSATTAKEAWEILDKVYKGAGRVKQVRLQTLRGELEDLKMKESEGVFDYITDVQMVVNQLKQNGETLTDSRVIEKVLKLLTNKFENVVCVVEVSKDIENITINDLADSLEAREQRKYPKRVEESTNLMTEEDVKVDGIVMMAYEVDGTVMMANEEVAPEIDTIWYLDTAASNHMCGDRIYLCIADDEFKASMIKRHRQDECLWIDENLVERISLEILSLNFKFCIYYTEMLLKKLMVCLEATIEMDLDELHKTETNYLDVYLDKLTLKNKEDIMDFSPIHCCSGRFCSSLGHWRLDSSRTSLRFGKCSSLGHWRLDSSRTSCISKNVCHLAIGAWTHLGHLSFKEMFVTWPLALGLIWDVLRPKKCSSLGHWSLDSSGTSCILGDFSSLGHWRLDSFRTSCILRDVRHLAIGAWTHLGRLMFQEMFVSWPLALGLMG
ncbi:hypothetical protein Tco_1530147 [Tanacetum coccineum]